MRYALGFLIAILALGAAAQAQTPNANAPTQNLEQYPSYIETSTTAPDGTEILIRCGYSQNGLTMAADPTYMELSALNQNNGTYLRYQRIDNKMLVTMPAQNAVGRFVIEVVEPNGTAVAKNCQNDDATDTIHQCSPAQPFMPAAQVTTQDQNAATQCGAFFNKASPQLNRQTYSAPKTEIFKNALRQKVNVLEAP